MDPGRGKCLHVYIRYAINGWGVLFLQEEKGFSDVEAISIVSINALYGESSEPYSRMVSRTNFFKGDRNTPRTDFRHNEYGSSRSVSLRGNAIWVNVAP